MKPKIMKCGHSNSFSERFRICVECQSTLEEQARKYRKIKPLIKDPVPTTLQEIQKIIEE